MKILIIEDESKVAEILKKGLTEELFEVDLAATGEEGFFKANANFYDLVLLDLVLPQCDGFEVLKLLRAQKDTPVIILSAKDDLENRVTALDGGADDYLTKPFAFAELIARIRAILRRKIPKNKIRLSAKYVEINLLDHTVTKYGQPVELTTKEFELLRYFLEQKNQIVTRQMLSQAIWQEDSSRLLSNIIDVHMAHLRKKIENSEDKLIQTIRGVGFVLR